MGHGRERIANVAHRSRAPIDCWAFRASISPSIVKRRERRCYVRVSETAKKTADHAAIASTGSEPPAFILRQLAEIKPLHPEKQLHAPVILGSRPDYSTMLCGIAESMKLTRASGIE